MLNFIRVHCHIYCLSKSCLLNAHALIRNSRENIDIGSHGFIPPKNHTSKSFCKVIWDKVKGFQLIFFEAIGQKKLTNHFSKAVFILKIF